MTVTKQKHNSTDPGLGNFTSYQSPISDVLRALIFSACFL